MALANIIILQLFYYIYMLRGPPRMSRRFPCASAALRSQYFCVFSSALISSSAPVTRFANESFISDKGDWINLRRSEAQPSEGGARVARRKKNESGRADEGEKESGTRAW
jgi:hypothetical protein